MIGIRSDLMSHILYSDDKFEFIICDVRLGGAKCIVVGAYRPPDSEPGLFASLNQQFVRLKIASKLSTHLFILGDFNLPSIKWDSGLVSSPPIYGLPVNNCAVDLFACYNLKQVVKKPTRLGQYSQNILDLVFTRSPHLVKNYSVEDGISDHKIVRVEFDLFPPRPLAKSKDILLYNKANRIQAATFLETNFEGLYI